MSSDSEDGGGIEPAFEAPSRPSSRGSRSSRVSSVSSSASGSHASRRSSRSGSRHLATGIPAHTGEPHPHQYGDNSHNSHHNSHVSDSHHHTKHESGHNHHEIQPFNVGSTHGKDDEPGPWPPEHSLLSRLALPLALIVGAGIMGGATYAVVARVQNLIANAAVDGDLASWKRKARVDVYDACYLGCTSCNDPEFAFKACKTTAQAIVKGINCDGNQMWNWAAEDRYPDKCLTAVAGILMGDALERLKQSYRSQLGLIALTLIGGLIAGVLAYKLIRMATMSKAERHAARSHRTWSLFKPKTWGKSSSSSPTWNSPSKPKRGGNKKLLAAFLGLFGARSAHAYACTGREAGWNQHFASPNGTISGVVHSWFSECRDRQDCHKTCKNTCTTSSSGVRTCSDKCTNDCKTVTISERVPKDFVDHVLPKVRACGFQVRDAPDGKTVATRVGNAGIEKNYWVRILVSGLNVTKPTETDEMVMCLHRIGNQ